MYLGVIKSVSFLETGLWSNGIWCSSPLHVSFSLPSGLARLLLGTVVPDATVGWEMGWVDFSQVSACVATTDILLIKVIIMTKETLSLDEGNSKLIWQRTWTEEREKICTINAINHCWMPHCRQWRFIYLSNYLFIVRFSNCNCKLCKSTAVYLVTLK